MIVRAGSIRNLKVITKDEKTLGTLVNIIFSTNPKLLGRAKLLIFPDLANHLKGELTETVTELVSHGIADNVPVASAKNTIENAGDKINELVQKDLSKTEAQRIAKFYLVPISKVGDIKERQKLILNGVFQDVDANFSFTDKESISDQEKAFYCAGAPKDGRLWSCSLNLVQMQNEPLDDPTGKGGEIEDIQLDTASGTVKNLIVSTTDDGAITRLVNLKDFDFTKMACTKAFKDCDTAD
jgi:sporulation protein YlmC with PRC-barrel domain